MPYMEADTSAKIGFRPYHQTDPFGAAHLSGYGSGLGKYSFNRPFDPWELYAETPAGLHGLGQNHPFKPEAWHLHGLGDASDDLTVQLAQQLHAQNLMTGGEADAIINGSMSFQDVLGYDPTDSSFFQSLPNLFREVNQDLQSVEQQVQNANNARLQANAQPTPEFSALAAQVNQQRQQYAALAQQFVHYWTLLMGSTPPGLSGLGAFAIDDIAALVIALAWLVAAVAALYALRDWSKSVDVSSLKAQTAAKSQDEESFFSQKLVEAQAKGDTVTAQTIQNQLNSIRATRAAQPADSLSTWFMQNAKWVAIGGVALVAAQGMFGKRR